MAAEASRMTAKGPSGSHAFGAPDDEELLDQVLGGDPEAYEEAFRALVSRHGPMVLGVCRQVLGREHDAEDVFQATFLVLARGAASIREKRALGGWLHGVAHRLAVRAKTGVARRRAKEFEAAERSAEEYRSGGTSGDLRPVLHEEVDRLPEVYREAVVLCYLEGRTNEEAAALLRWPVGTVKGRLSKARVILRSRLTRRGVALAAAFLMARLSPGAAFAEAVPSDLSGTTVRAAVTFAREGSGDLADGLSDRVLDLIAGELGPAKKTLRRVGLTVSLVAVVATLLGGVAVASGSGDVTYRRCLGLFMGPAGVTAHGACHRTR